MFHAPNPFYEKFSTFGTVEEQALVDPYNLLALESSKSSEQLNLLLRNTTSKHFCNCKACPKCVRENLAVTRISGFSDLYQYQGDSKVQAPVYRPGIVKNPDIFPKINNY